MVAVAAPQQEMAWVCPVCGHGSPEPRDEQAHLDAHRQLERFIADWDAAAAADQAAERDRRRRPLYFAVVVVVVVALAVMALQGIGGNDVTPSVPTAPGVGAEPPPGGFAPRPGFGTGDPSAPGGGPAPDAASPASPSGGTPLTPSPSPSPSSPANGGPAGGDQAPSTASPANPVPPLPPATTAGSQPPVTIRGCLLRLVCVTLG